MYNSGVHIFPFGDPGGGARGRLCQLEQFYQLGTRLLNVAQLIALPTCRA
jgi:hypothetical protein